MAPAYRRQGYVHPHQLRQQRLGRLHAALQGARAHDEQAHVEPLADAGLVRVVAAGRRSSARLHHPNNLLPFVGQGRRANDQPHAFKVLGSYQAPCGINVGANYQVLSGLPRDRSLERAVRAGHRQHPRRTARDLPRRLRSTCSRCGGTRSSASTACVAARRSSPSCTTC